MIRAFVALPMPDSLRDRLEELGDDIEEGRPTDPENLHLTLAFLGEQRPELLEDVAVELERLSPPAPTLALRGVGVFGGGRPRSAHVMAAADSTLSALRDSVRRACRRGGLELPHARFTPHVTVARFSTRAPAGEGLARWLARNAGFAAEPFQPDAAALYRSDLGPAGPIYRELLEIPLG
ncbi:RNA 2',3'-cyclic phosphodiesterase [uncultured Albimonas sp.]|uniref:RNA 2',3'-cyclic phosphodiesterase n=1 Tax=uncultured Albimonas sp. TaxID=1331701 RepID=UPI0030EC7EA1